MEFCLRELRPRSLSALSETNQAASVFADLLLRAFSPAAVPHGVPRRSEQFRARHSSALPRGTVLPARSAGCDFECTGLSRPVQRPARQPGRPYPHIVFRALLLRMDLPPGLHSSLLRKLQIGTQARQAMVGLEPLPAMAEHQVLPASCCARGGCTGQRNCGLAGPVLVFGALTSLVDPAGHQLWIAGFPKATGTKSVGNGAGNWSSAALPFRCAGAQFQAALFPTRRLAGRALHLHHCSEFSDHTLLVSRNLPVGSAFGADLPLVRAGPGERLREMQ